MGCRHCASALDCAMLISPGFCSVSLPPPSSLSSFLDPPSPWLSVSQAANVLLDESNEPVIADFGLAKEMDVKDTHANTAVKGTIGHIAPGGWH